MKKAMPAPVPNRTAAPITCSQRRIKFGLQPRLGHQRVSSSTRAIAASAMRGHHLDQRAQRIEPEARASPCWPPQDRNALTAIMPQQASGAQRRTRTAFRQGRHRPLPRTARWPWPGPSDHPASDQSSVPRFRPQDAGRSRPSSEPEDGQHRDDDRQPVSAIRAASRCSAPAGEARPGSRSSPAPPAAGTRPPATPRRRRSTPSRQHRGGRSSAGASASRGGQADRRSGPTGPIRVQSGQRGQSGPAPKPSQARCAKHDLFQALRNRRSRPDRRRVRAPDSPSTAIEPRQRRGHPVQRTASAGRAQCNRVERPGPPRASGSGWVPP